MIGNLTSIKVIGTTTLIGGLNKEADEKSAYNNVQVGDGPQQREMEPQFLQTMQVGPQQREIRKEILQAMQVGEGQQI